MHNSVAVIVGPTASGKTALGVAVAKALNGEVISADSMQIYQTMDIATAKPTAEEMDGVAHHLIGVVAPTERFSVAAYKQRCEAAIRDVLQRGKLPVLVGGTGLYIDAVVQNTTFLEVPQTAYRETLAAKAETCGTRALLEDLFEIDPETAQHLHESDKKRIIRALEVYYATGKTMTEQRLRSHDTGSAFRFCMIGLTAEDRQVLYDRIDRRVDRMLADGLLEEARAFFASAQAATAKQAIGYKELKPFLDGTEPLSVSVDRLKRETRRYAKRQLTWFRKNPDIQWLMIDKESKDSLIRKSVSAIQTFLGEEP